MMRTLCQIFFTLFICTQTSLLRGSIHQAWADVDIEMKCRCKQPKQGPPGERGPTGEQGPTGERGPTGEQGDPGTGVYLTAFSNFTSAQSVLNQGFIPFNTLGYSSPDQGIQKMGDDTFILVNPGSYYIHVVVYGSPNNGQIRLLVGGQIDPLLPASAFLNGTVSLVLQGTIDVANSNTELQVQFNCCDTGSGDSLLLRTGTATSISIIKLGD